MKKEAFILFVIALMSVSLSFAQPPGGPPGPPGGTGPGGPPCWPPPCIPIDQADWVLMLAGLGYVVYLNKKGKLG